MKTARIDITGTHGSATIFRSGSDIVINISRLVGRGESWVVPARPTAEADRQERDGPPSSLSGPEGQRERFAKRW